MRFEKMKIHRSIVEQIIDHARHDQPLEACGYLAGKDGVVTAIYRLTNADASPEHFSFAPTEQFAAVKQMRAAGIKMISVYHSHPASPARPSAEDIRLANDPSLSYVIVSLLGPQPEVKSFLIRQGEAHLDPLEILED